MTETGPIEPQRGTGGFFRAVFYRSPQFAVKEATAGKEKRFGERFGGGAEKTSEKILALLQERSTASAREIAGILGLTSRAVEKQVAALKAAGRLRRVGPDKGGHWEVLK